MQWESVMDFARRYKLPEEGTNELMKLLVQASSSSDQRTFPGVGTGRTAQKSEHQLDRYEDLGPLGAGGMGEVRRVRDTVLNRVVAMKIITGRSEMLEARFTIEAQATAQLQHPAIIPVYDQGFLPDGRGYYTMKEIRGKTFREVMDTADRTLYGLVSMFRTACEAVGYAHSRQVLHRDLKPPNIMIGDFGEVLVLDWGLAKVLRIEGAGHEQVITTEGGEENLTMVGSITGTPAYMAPEQAEMDCDPITPRADVYSLGSILYEILSGRPPFEGKSALLVLARLVQGPPTPLSNDPLIPAELVTICERAMARDPEDRYPDARELAEDLSDWLEGATRRTHALKVVERARTLRPRAKANRARAEDMREMARRSLEGMEPWAPAEQKQPGWELEDLADQLDLAAGLDELEATRTLHGALTHVPDLPEAHRELVRHYRVEHEAAEKRGDAAMAPRTEVLLAAHASALPESDPLRLMTASYLKGEGTLTLLTEPEGALVKLYGYEQRGRRATPVFEREFGHTPLMQVSLPMGSYVLRIEAPGREPVLYPVLMGRKHYWSGTPPQGSAPAKIYLPSPDELEPGDCYVPAGWYQFGGDPGALAGLPGKLAWVDGFVIRKVPTLNREYQAFLRGLGAHDDALLPAGWTRRTAPAPACPVTGLDWASATAYAEWKASTTGLDWRLPTELEWEKAARGVDGRVYPFGRFLDPSWCLIRQSQPGQPECTSVEDFPQDESPYGVIGLAGGVRDWCGAASGRDNPVQVSRGGSFLDDDRGARCASRHVTVWTAQEPSVGMRLVRSFPTSSPSR